MSEVDQPSPLPYSARMREGTHADGGAPYQARKFYEQNEGGLKSIDGTKIYYLGIIDIFTHYNVKKKAEHFLKSIKYDGLTISCIPPD